jgi:catechol 2,3-dioxygenase-like lactoylglutathione lyase family enzyme
MTITHLRHIGIFSPDLGKQREFYRAIWGLDQIDEETDAVYFRGASPEHHLLSLHPAKRCGLHHIAFGVSNEEDVGRTARELQSRGIRLVSEPQPLGEPGGGYGFRFFDPEGRCIELSAGVIQHQGGWQAKPVQPHSICHVVLNTTRMDDMIGFYTNILGFRISDWSENQMVFLRCNSKHHAIALNRAPHASLNHIAYLVSNVDEVMRGMVNMRKHGFEPGWGPGRHGPGNNIFCYFKEPLEYVVEYTSDIDYIQDEASHQPKVWPRTPELIDRWGTAGPPGADIRHAMEGEPDPGWQP